MPPARLERRMTNASPVESRQGIASLEKAAGVIPTLSPARSVLSRIPDSIVINTAAQQNAGRHFGQEARMHFKTNGQSNSSLTPAKINWPRVQRNINTRLNCPTGGHFAMFALLACGFGVYVGLHFNVLVLLPLSFLGAG